MLKVKWDTYVTTGVPTCELPANAPVNPNRVLLPTGSASAPAERTTIHVYSAELQNSGPKAIEALLWDFIFTDAADSAELGRHTLASVQTINPNRKKTVEFRTTAAPPRLVSAGSLQKDQRSPFTNSVKILCLKFVDGSVWQEPTARRACQDLQRWIAVRKTGGSRVEDLPFKK